MASNTLFPFLLILLLLAQAHGVVKADTLLIQKTCKNTNYYKLCYSSLKSDPRSRKADPKGLAAIMIGIGMTNATATSSFLSSELIATTNDTVLRRVFKECADKYKYAGDALQDSLQDLANDLYDYAYLHITAAADYPNACHNAFKRYRGLVYPPQLAPREDALKHICDVALAIVDSLNSF
ncbi:hypothetical protein L6164_025019 [Bauhinia variegata]|uniref:Uncharacterized protein n=1 Tax=Bauhinia variegata TaxID=167791 RepID=A0ACB9M1T7_BAUVA|nr:hypothetical protein L6164_025019 [Bauhinia variegata]